MPLSLVGLGFDLGTVIWRMVFCIFREEELTERESQRPTMDRVRFRHARVLDLEQALHDSVKRFPVEDLIACNRNNEETNVLAMSLRFLRIVFRSHCVSKYQCSTLWFVGLLPGCVTCGWAALMPAHDD